MIDELVNDLVFERAFQFNQYGMSMYTKGKY